jgi:hypothetical protein
MPVVKCCGNRPPTDTAAAPPHLTQLLLWLRVYAHIDRHQRHVWSLCLCWRLPAGSGVGEGSQLLLKLVRRRGWCCHVVCVRWAAQQKRGATDEERASH